MEKAHDMMWKEGLLIKLDIMGVGGKVYNWIMDFLFGRAIRVRAGNSFSERYVVENGTPQGSVIGPLLFSIMINDVYRQIGSDIGKSLFADDGAIWKRGRNINYVVGKVQEAIIEIQNWSLTWGFKLSVEKSETVFFFTRKRIGEDISLKLYGQELKKVKAFKFLGILVDERITWKIHIDKVEDKCKKVLNIMRCLAGTMWGADKVPLRSIYTTLIRSVLDYGLIVFGSAACSSLQKLDSSIKVMLRGSQVYASTSTSGRSWTNASSFTEKTVNG